jgi:hypothetical protein
MKNNKILAALLVFLFSFSIVTPTFGVTKAIVATNPVSATNATVNNKFIDSVTTQGTIIFNPNTFTKGDTVKITDSKKNPLGEIIISDATSASSINVTGLGRKKGKVSITVTPLSADYSVSKAVAIDFSAQKSPAAIATNISLVGNADKPDDFKIIGVEADDVVTVYPPTASVTGKVATDAKAYAKGKAKAAGELIFALGKSNITIEKGIRVSITKKDCEESDRILIAGGDLNYISSSGSTDISNISVVKGGVLISGLVIDTVAKEKMQIDVYSTDPTKFLSKSATADDKKALKNILLGSKSATKGSHVFIEFKKEVEDYAKVYIAKKSTGKSVIITWAYAPIALDSIENTLTEAATVGDQLYAGEIKAKTPTNASKYELQNYGIDEITHYVYNLNYRWQRSDKLDGIYKDIAGAKNQMYTLSKDDAKKFIRVLVTPNNTINFDYGPQFFNYYGELTSTSTVEVKPAKIIKLSNETIFVANKQYNTEGIVRVGSTLVTSTQGMARHKWQICDTVDGTYVDLENRTYDNIYEDGTPYYTTVEEDVNKFIRVVATGIGIYAGTVTSVPTKAVAPLKQITSIGAITPTTTGTAIVVGTYLTAGKVLSEGVEVTQGINYRWMVSDTENGTYKYSNKMGYVGYNQYQISQFDANKYIKVEAYADQYHGYTGKVTSVAVKVAPAGISSVSMWGEAKVGSKLVARTNYKETASYKWQICNTTDGTYTDIAGATASTYIPVASDATKFIKVMATGIGNYTGTVTSSPTKAIAAMPASSSTITKFSFSEIDVIGAINEETYTIALTVPKGTDVTRLIAIFTTTAMDVEVEEGMYQESEFSTNDFTSPVKYKVTAADNTSATYTVTVTVSP